MPRGPRLGGHPGAGRHAASPPLPPGPATVSVGDRAAARPAPAPGDAPEAAAREPIAPPDWPSVSYYGPGFDEAATPGILGEEAPQRKGGVFRGPRARSIVFVPGGEDPVRRDTVRPGPCVANLHAARTARTPDHGLVAPVSAAIAPGVRADTLCADWRKDAACEHACDAVVRKLQSRSESVGQAMSPLRDSRGAGSPDGWEKPLAIARRRPGERVPPSRAPALCAAVRRVVVSSPAAPRNPSAPRNQSAAGKTPAP